MRSFPNLLLNIFLFCTITFELTAQSVKDFKFQLSTGPNLTTPIVDNSNSHFPPKLQETGINGGYDIRLSVVRKLKTVDLGISFKTKLIKYTYRLNGLIFPDDIIAGTESSVELKLSYRTFAISPFLRIPVSKNNHFIDIAPSYNTFVANSS